MINCYLFASRPKWLYYSVAGAFRDWQPVRISGLYDNTWLDSRMFRHPWGDIVAEERSSEASHQNRCFKWWEGEDDFESHAIGIIWCLETKLAMTLYPHKKVHVQIFLR